MPPSTKHVVLGRIFLKHIAERRDGVLAEWGDEAVDDRDEYVAKNVLRVLSDAGWTHLRRQAKQPTVGLTIDQAMATIQRDNPALNDVVPRDHVRPALSKRRLGQTDRPRQQHPRDAKSRRSVATKTARSTRLR